MPSAQYTATKGLDLTGSEVAAWMNATSATTLTGSPQQYVTDIVGNSPLKNLTVNGSITLSAVNTGCELMGYSGFSASNYLSQAYDSDLDFGTADFCVMGWIKSNSSANFEYILSRSYYSGVYSGSAIILRFLAGGLIRCAITNDGYASNTDTVDTTTVVNDNNWYFIIVQRISTVINIYVNGSLEASTTITNASGSLSNASAVLNFGVDGGIANPLTNANLSLWRFGAYSLTAEQISDIYNNEKILFETYEKYTQIGIDYNFDFSAVELTRSNSTIRNQSKALGGAVETLRHRDEILWNIQSEWIAKNSLTNIRRFLDSVLDGQTFTFDPYGTLTTSPQVVDKPVNAVLENNAYTENRAMVGANGTDTLLENDVFSLGFQVRGL